MTKSTIRRTLLAAVSGLALVSMTGCGNQPAATGNQVHEWNIKFQPKLPIFTASKHQARWLYGVSFATKTRGVVVGDNAYVGLTTNAGKSWTHVKVPTIHDLRGISWATPKIGVAVGDNRTILRTTDGGAVWTKVAPPKGLRWYDLEAIKFATAKVGYIVGDTGTILKTIDGGKVWSQQKSGTKIDLRSVSAATVNRVAAVGDHGVVLLTTNGGNNWKKTWTPQDAALYSVFYYPHSHTLWTVGTAPRKNDIGIQGANVNVYKSTTAGKSWNTYSTGQTSSVWSMYFTTKTKGWAVDEGQVLHTTNGGKTWDAKHPVYNQPSGTDWWAESITKAPHGSFWFVGIPSTSGPGGLSTGQITIFRSTSAAGTKFVNGGGFPQPKNSAAA